MDSECSRKEMLFGKRSEDEVLLLGYENKQFSEKLSNVSGPKEGL